MAFSWTLSWSIPNNYRTTSKRILIIGTLSVSQVSKTTQKGTYSDRISAAKNVHAFVLLKKHNSPGGNFEQFRVNPNSFACYRA